MRIRTEPYHLTHDIYALPGDARAARPWIGMVLTREGTVLLDSGAGPLHAAAIQEALDGLEALPVTHILLTHHHWDHVFGSHYFPGAQVIAHELTQRHLQVMAGEPWSEEYVLSKGDSFPRGRIVSEWMLNAVPDWRSFQVVPASETFSDRYELTLGGYTFHMQHVGGQHEPDQCIIQISPGEVLFLGDATYGRASKDEWDYPELARALRGFMSQGAQWFVEGHRTPSDRARFLQRIERLEQRAG